MNRSAKGLLRTFVLVPVAAAATVLAVPAGAQPGPATALVYGAAARAVPVTHALPEPVAGTVGQAADLGAGSIDGLLGTAQGAADRRTPGPATGGGATPTQVGGLLGLPERLDSSAAHIRGSEVGGLLGGAETAPAGRTVARPAPPVQDYGPAPTTEQDLLGQANGVLNTVDRGLGATEGQVAEVLTAEEAAPGSSGAAKPPIPGLR